MRIEINIPDWLAKSLIQLLLLYRKLHFGYAFRKILLTDCHFAMVDPKDYPLLSKYKWHSVKSCRGFYACRRTADETIYMHRQIINTPSDMVCDHIDHNSLNNCRRNLRNCTSRQNNYNQRPQRNKSSKYKGVYRCKRSNKWRSRIQINGKRISLGSFNSQIGAARAYDNAALKHFKQFAFTNFKEKEKCKIEESRPAGRNE